MSRARAPGKLVLSGAYAVLSGAPALVAAVNRYVLADSAREPTFIAPEVQRAIGSHTPPWFDASALRQNGEKLGLGSSAAILVASLAALELDRDSTLDDEALSGRVYERALTAHRSAQGGGSGVDVAASAHGGVLAARRVEGQLELGAVTLPIGLVFEVWACRIFASTADFLARIRAFAVRDPALHRACLDEQAAASEAALLSVHQQSATGFVRAIARQFAALTALGEASDVGIVTAEHAELGRLALASGAAFLPAGAGGGDVAYFVGTQAPPADFDACARGLGLWRLDLELGARGVQRV
jgi:phosphomevalonate kinase